MTQSQVRSRRPRDRRRSIELAAAELFAARGFAATGLADIAAKVGVTPAAIYRHFAGKDELLETIVLGSIRAMGDAAEEALAASGTDAQDALRQVVSTLFDVARAAPDAVKIYIRERHRLSGPAREHRHEGEVRLAGTVRSLVLQRQPDLSPAELDVRLRAMNGVLAAGAIRRHTLPPAKVRALYIDGLVAVLLAPPDAREARAVVSSPTGWSPPRTRRAEILDAAAKLFRVNGYHGAGIDQIGEAAGIAGPTVYGTYPSKSDILVDAVDYAVTMLEVLTDRALRGAGSAEEALVLLAESYAETIVTNLDIVAVAVQDMKYLPDTDRPRIRRRQDDYRQRAQSVLLEVRPELTEAEARSLFTGAYALVGEVAFGRRTPSVQATARPMVRFLLAGAEGG